MKRLCPSCGAVIETEDINVEADTALCRACGGMHAFSALVHGDVATTAGIVPDDPPRGAWFHVRGAEMVVGASTANAVLAVFMLFFTGFWNGITWLFVVMAVAGLLNALGVPIGGGPSGPFGNGGMGLGFSIFLVVFVTPFVLVGLVTAAFLVMSVCGKNEIRLRGDEGTLFRGVGPIGSRKRFEASSVTAVRIERARSETNGKPDRQITLVGPDVSFGTMLTPRRRQWVAGMLQSLIVDAR